MRMRETINIDQLAREITILRSFVIGIAGRDSEGEYRPEFVTKILKLNSEKVVGKFSSAKDFLAKLKMAK